MVNRTHGPMCDCDVIHPQAVSDARQRLSDAELLYSVSDFFKVMADSTRMRILAALDGGELCVCDLSAALSMTKSAVSHQLKVLKDADLVTYRRDGKNVYYALSDDHVRLILETGMAHVQEREESE